MKYAILSDIHSNLEALEAVLADMKHQHIHHGVCLGDIVGYGPDPSECLEIVRKLKWPTVRGNHDHHAAEKMLPDWFSKVARAGLEYTRSKLTKEQKKYLGKLPFTLESHGFEIVHAALSEPEAWPYVFDGLEAELHFAAQKKQVSFCGHTHQPCIWQHDRKLFFPGLGNRKLTGEGKFLINAGSVGLPRDGDPRACYVVYEPKQHQIKFRRVEYDTSITRHKIIVAGLPAELAAKLA